MFRQCNILFSLFFYGRLELIRECGIIWFSIGLWNCSDSVALLIFHFSIRLWNCSTVWHYLFLYGTLELFRQYGIICFDMGLWNCSDSVALFVFLMVFDTVPTV
jgi:hypothetical protein